MSSHQRAVHALWTKFMGCCYILWPAWARLQGMAKLVAVLGESTLRPAKT
jgi:hypothetical protein